MVSVLETFDREVKPGSKYSRRIEGLPWETLQRVVEFVVIDRSVIFPALSAYTTGSLRTSNISCAYTNLPLLPAGFCLIGYVSMASSVNDWKCIFNLIIIQGKRGKLEALKKHANSPLQCPYEGLFSVVPREYVY